MKKACLLTRAFWGLLFLPLISLQGASQITEATLKLSVTDTQNHSVAGASVELVNEETGVKRAALIDVDGQATMAGLSPGDYLVVLKAQGFKTYQQKKLRLGVGQTYELKIQLDVGEV